MEQLNSKLSRVSENLGALLDKAICEPEFRWKMILEKDAIIKMFAITKEVDLEVYDEIVYKLNTFILNRAIDQQNLPENYLKNEIQYNRTNPQLIYEDALLKKH